MTMDARTYLAGQALADLAHCRIPGEEDSLAAVVVALADATLARLAGTQPPPLTAPPDDAPKAKLERIRSLIRNAVDDPLVTDAWVLLIQILKECKE